MVREALLGLYASNSDVEAILDSNRFFQRNACIVDSTGSGKSYTVVSGKAEIKAKECNYRF